MENLQAIKDILKELWLEEKEISIYFACLKIWTTVASNIWKILRIPKSTVRYSLENLVKKQIMIKSQKWNTTLFTPEHPQKLKNLLIIEKNIIENKEKKLQRVMWDLIWLYNPHTKIPKVTFYEWIDWIKKVLDLSLGAKWVIDSYVDVEAISGIFDEWNKEYVEKKEKLKIKKRSIYSETSENQKYLKNFYKKFNDDFNKVKFINKQKNYFLESYLVFMIYDEKITFITLEESNPIWIIIENKIIYNFQKNMFNFMWNNI